MKFLPRSSRLQLPSRISYSSQRQCFMYFPSLLCLVSLNPKSLSISLTFHHFSLNFLFSLALILRGCLALSSFYFLFSFWWQTMPCSPHHRGLVMISLHGSDSGSHLVCFMLLWPNHEIETIYCLNSIMLHGPHPLP